MFRFVAHFSKPVDTRAFNADVLRVLAEKPRVDPFVIFSGIIMSMRMVGIETTISFFPMEGEEGNNELQGMWGRN